MSCTEESSEEEVAVSKEHFLQLSCFISPEVRYMMSGLKSKMKETLIKHSANLGRDANYNRSVKCSYHIALYFYDKTMKLNIIFSSLNSI